MERGTESSSGSLTGTSYTIDQLESTTIYTVTVRASNVAGTTDSQPIIFSTGRYNYTYSNVCLPLCVPRYHGHFLNCPFRVHMCCAVLSIIQVGQSAPGQ